MTTPPRSSLPPDTDCVGCHEEPGEVFLCDEGWVGASCMMGSVTGVTSTDVFNEVSERGDLHRFLLRKWLRRRG